MNGLEALEEIKDYIGMDLTFDCKEQVFIIEKQLKALEIIKKHIKVVNGQLMFKGISYKKNNKDYHKILEVLEL